MNNSKRKIWVCVLPFIVVLGCVLTAWFVINFVTLPECMLHKYTGFYCPGCGSTRAVIALLHGDILLSLRQNPMIVTLIVCGVILYTEPLFKAFGKMDYRSPIRNYYFFIHNNWNFYGVQCCNEILCLLLHRYDLLNYYEYGEK